MFSFEGTIKIEKSGGDSKEEPPVPMPNTEVKLLNADDTWRVTARESRKLPELKKTQSICFESFLVIAHDKPIEMC